MVSVYMRLLYYLMMSDDSLPEKDREAARAMLTVALNLKKDIGKDTNLRATLVHLLEKANGFDIKTSEVVVLSASRD